MTDKPTVGRIVHFYTKTPPTKPGSAEPGINAAGEGPYAALVIQRFDSGDYVSLHVFAFDYDWMEGSVSEGDPENNPGRCWCWPPRV